AGLTCAVRYVAAQSGVGMRIDVALVPRRARAMTPYEVMLSESQERMLVIARPGRERDVERIFQKWELHGSRIGQVTSDEVLEIRDGTDVVASLPPRSLAVDAPEYDISGLAASYRSESAEGAAARSGTGDPTWSPEGRGGTDTVVGPSADAAVMRIKGRADGIALAIDAQPRLAAIDPFVGAAAAVAEATRNLVCMGATPLAITDCLNVGNPERPKGAWQL